MCQAYKIKANRCMLAFSFKNATSSYGYTSGSSVMFQAARLANNNYATSKIA